MNGGESCRSLPTFRRCCYDLPVTIPRKAFIKLTLASRPHTESLRKLDCNKAVKVMSETGSQVRIVRFATVVSNSPTTFTLVTTRLVEHKNTVSHEAVEYSHRKGSECPIHIVRILAQV